MISKRLTYDGITGVTSPEEVRAILAGVVKLGPARRVGVKGRPLMLGVVASLKSLFLGGNSKPRRYPAPEKIPPIFEAMREAEQLGIEVLGLLHYGTDTDNAAALLPELVAARLRAGAACKGMQINLAWPDPEVMEDFHHERPADTIVLQVGPRAQEEDFFAEHMAATLRPYADFVDAFLFDASAGEGKPVDFEAALRFFAVVQRVSGRVGFGLAGGLCADRLRGELATSIFRAAIPTLSTDAEGRLRAGPEGGDLQIHEALEHLAEINTAIGRAGAERLAARTGRSVEECERVIGLSFANALRRGVVPSEDEVIEKLATARAFIDARDEREDEIAKLRGAIYEGGVAPQPEIPLFHGRRSRLGN